MSALKTLLFGGSLLATVSATSYDQFSSCSTTINNVCFQQSVESLVYQNVGYSGSYPNVALFDTETCSVDMGSSTAFSGNLAPLNEEITMHFRGPLILDSVAVYLPGPAFAESKKIKKREASLRRKHVHRHIDAHKHKRGEYTATVTQFSTLYVDPAPTAVSSTSTKKHKPSTKKSSSKTTSSSASATPTGEWVRSGYYDANTDTVEGLTFMNNMGAQGVSGAWSTCFGNTLSYMGSDGLSATTGPTCLDKHTFFPSNKEFSIWTNQTCDSSCGYSQPGTPAMKGFDGDNKVFVFKFKMPKDTSLVNNNMPAIWFLNSKIGRTWQYPNDATKTPWPLCGEFDVWEVLDPMSCDYMKSHLHSGQGASDSAGLYGGGGSGMYFERPYDQFMTGAVSFMDDGTISINVLDDSFDFPGSLETDDIKSWTPSSAAKFLVPS